MKIAFFLINCLLFSVAGLYGNLEVSVTGVQSKGNKGAVKLKLKNGFDQGIRSARVWVFMFDDEGKVAGNQSQWLFGGEGEGPGLEDSQEKDYIVPVESVKPFSSAQVTFSRIILEDGTTPDPQTSVIEAAGH
ncbi:MAG: hypothetical protein AAF984_10810 [Verrucomicrobiota bacterium]